MTSIEMLLAVGLSQLVDRFDGSFIAFLCLQ